MPVSGPGPYAKRTDRQPVRDPGGLPYGENQALRQQQQAAPMAQAPAATPFDAPTARPGQPVTAGANAGPGPDQSVLGQRPGGYPTSLSEALANAAANDPTGIIAALLMEATKRGF
jgi:hypothetical protein